MNFGAFAARLSFFTGAFVSEAAEPSVMRYRHNAPESALDVRYSYHWKVLEAALERNRRRYGAYRLETAEVMTEQRQRHELEQASGAVTVVYLGTTPEMERALVPVRIPIDKGLAGYNVFLIRRERVREFHAGMQLADLNAFRFGLGLGWIDVGILRANGLRVVTGSNYEGLFDMVNNGRFDVFPRSAVEVLDELKRRYERFPELAIEPSLLLHYPMPMYFWFARTEEGRRLAQRAEEGLREMLADGSFDRMFEAHYRDKITRLGLKQRRIIRITNPNLGPETPLDDARLWFDPEKFAALER